MNKENFEYLRPASLDEVTRLLAENPDKIKFLAGGSFKPILEDGKTIIVDLQDAGLDSLEVTEQGFTIGGLATLQDLDSALGSSGFYQALSTEYGLNVRNTLSLSNFLAQANGRSPVLVCLLALDPVVYSLEHPDGLSLRDFMLSTPTADVVIKVEIPAFKNLRYEGVGRSPKDLPIVSVAINRQLDGNLRVACGGTIEIWETFELSQSDEDDLEQISNLYQNSDDSWASAEYRQDVAKVLLTRVLQKLESIA
jgi:CO/xanthine dehydrogenase FAD-binding subunit